jgi:antitoxin component YwqK of YwqJK toxin-antitoxin module
MKTIFREDYTVSHYDSGQIYEEYYYVDNNRHRVDGPAWVRYFENGQIEEERYYLNGDLHRINGPASIRYYQSGNVREEAYSLKNYFHRVDGPAIIDYDESQEIKYKLYFLNGRELPFFENYDTLKDKIFEYIKFYPRYINEVEVLARHNNWLSEHDLLLLRTFCLFTE